MAQSQSRGWPEPSTTWPIVVRTHAYGQGPGAGQAPGAEPVHEDLVVAEQVCVGPVQFTNQSVAQW